jgi:hypothetical protein
VAYGDQHLTILQNRNNMDSVLGAKGQQFYLGKAAVIA